MKYSTKEFAVASGVPGGTLRRWAVEGRLIPAERHGKKGNFYDESQIAEAQSLYLEKRPNAKLHIAEVAQKENVNDTAINAQEAAQATIDAVDDQTPADVQNAAKINDSASIDTREDFAEASPTLVEENLAAVTIDVEAEIVTLDQRADRIRKLAADVTRGIIEIGNELIAAKAEIGHGNFTEWLKENFDWSDRTARYFMSVAQRFGKRNTYSVLKSSTLKEMLSLPVGSEDEFIAQQAEKGKPVGEMSTQEVKDAVKEFNQQRNGELEETADTVQAGKTENDDNTSDTPETNSPAEADDSAVDMSQKKTPPPISRNHNGTVEYFTPKEIVDAARRVFGGTIDLDPASCALANETVKAEKFFSIDDDGLSQMWHGNIWLNPPYTNKPPFTPPYPNSPLLQFVYKLLASDFTAAIVLVDAATDTKWFKDLAAACAGIVFTAGRVNCLPHGEKNSSGPTRGSAIFYIGDDADKFFAEFEQFGFGVYPRKKKYAR